jgi:hypothetical protein
MFECRAGRVTFLDLEALLDEVRRALPAKAEELKTRWEITDVTAPSGAFQLRYTVARARSSALDSAFSGLPPANDRDFTYGVTRWEIVPVQEHRGETAAEALSPHAAFFQIVQAVEPKEVSITLFVYPDSFDLYRVLRDALYERGFVVAGRPLPFDVPISGSRSGTISRGQ